MGWFVNSNDVSCLSYVFVCDMCLYVLLAENVKGGSFVWQRMDMFLYVMLAENFKGGLLAQVMCV